MARPTALNTAQWGLEGVGSLGVPVAANKRLLCTQARPSAVVPTDPYTPQGFLVPTTAIQQKESTEIPLEGVICYNDLPYILSSLLKTVSPTTPSGATNTRRWTFTPSATSIDAFKSYTIEKGTSSQAERVAGCVVRNATFRWSRTDANFSGAMMGQVYTEGITITASPTDIAERPVDPKAVSVYVGSTHNTNNIQTITITGSPTGGTWTATFEGQTTATPIAYNANAAAVQAELEKLSTLGKNITVGGGAGPGTPWTVTFTNIFAGVNASTLTVDGTGLTGGTSPAIAVTNTTPGGMTKLSSVYTAELAIPDKYAFAYTLDDSKQSWSEPVQIAFQPQATLTLQHDSAGAALMTDLRNRTTRYCKILCRGVSPIETVSSVPFQNVLSLMFPFKYLSPSPTDVDGVDSLTYPLALMYDAVFGGFLTAAVDTSVASL